MTHLIKTTLMAVLALFTFNTVANAQFGLLKNVVKEVAFDKRRHVWRAGGRSQSELST